MLEEQSKLFEAIDLVGGYIAQAPTMRDASLAYYRMAYLQWRVGSHEGSAACFRTAIAMHTDIAAQAQTELSELLDSDSEQKDYSEEEALEVLQAKGIDIWPREERFAEIARAAIACTNDQLYPAAQQLALAILEYRRDDALIDVYRSLVSGGSAQ